MSFAAAAPSAAPGVAAPYRGLAPFGESELDALLFFGRERETEIAVANLIASRLTILYGPSGVGKSSLLRAGVARRVRELGRRRAVGRGPDVAVVVFASWSGDAVRELSGAIAAEIAPLVSPLAPPPPPGDASLADVVEHWAAMLDGDLCLVLDQLEEHFVYREDESGPGTLLGELPEVVLRPGLRANVLLSLRDDTLSRLDVFKSRVPNLFANTLRLDRLDHDAGRAAILGPVERWNELAAPGERVEVEPELVEAVLAQSSVAADAGRVEPPYLQLVMERLWNAERDAGSRVLRRSTLFELGGAAAIVRDHLDRALAVLGPDEQEAAARMFEHLVTPSGTKIAHRSADLAEFAHLPERAVVPVLGALGRERIVRQLDTTEGAGDRYEIFHDVLAQAILDWRRRHEVEHERADAQRRHRRLAVVAVAALAGLVLMTGVAAYALSQRHEARQQTALARAEARRAQARELGGSALRQLGSDPELSMLLALDGARLSPSRQVADVLRQSLIFSRVRRVTRLGAPVDATAFTRRGDAVVALTQGGTLAIVDPGTGRVRRRLRVREPTALLDATGAAVLAWGPRRAEILRTTGARTTLAAPPVTTGAFSSRGEYAATLHRDGSARVWRVRDGRVVGRVRVGRARTSLGVTRDGLLLAVGGGGRGVWVYDMKRSRLLRHIRMRDGITKLRFGPSGLLLAAVAGSVVRTYEARTGRLYDVFEGHKGPITDLEFNAAGTRLVTASTDGTGRVWKVGSGGALAAPLVGHTNYVLSAVFGRRGELVVTTSRDRTARVARSDDGRTVAALVGHRDRVVSASLSPDGRIVATASLDGTVRLWDAVAQSPLTEVARRPYPIAAARFVDGRVAIAPRDAADLAAAGGVVATAVGKTVTVDGRSFRVPARVTGVALSRDARTVAVAGTDGVVRLYDASGRLDRTFRDGSSRLTRIAFSPQENQVAAGSADGTAKVWDVATGRLRVLRGHADVVESARFSPDGRHVVTASRDHDVRVWDVATRTTEHVLDKHFAIVSDAAYSPNGRWIVTAGPQLAGLFAADSGEFVTFLQGHEGRLTSASFDARGLTVLTSSIDGTVRRWTCDICGGLPQLVRLAEARLLQTGRVLSPGERREYLP